MKSCFLCINFILLNVTLFYLCFYSDTAVKIVSIFVIGVVGWYNGDVTGHNSTCHALWKQENSYFQHSQKGKTIYQKPFPLSIGGKVNLWRYEDSPIKDIIRNVTKMKLKVPVLITSLIGENLYFDQKGLKYSNIYAFWPYYQVPAMNMSNKLCINY